MISDLIPDFANSLLSFIVHAESDPSESLALFRISVERRVLKDRDQARELWESLIKRHGNSAQFWLEYIACEREIGELNKVRTLFKQAVNRGLDYPDAIFEGWLAFEREQGDLASLYTALDRIEVRRRQIAVKIQKALQEQENGSVEAYYQAHGGYGGAEMAVDQAGAGIQAGQKRKKGDGGVMSKKKGKTEDGAVEVKGKKADKGKGKEKTEAGPPQQAEEAQQPMETETELKESEADATAKTIYVSKLPVDVADATLRQLFARFGLISDVRIVKRPTTAFAYIEFVKASGAKKACALDGHVFESTGKAIKVAISNPALKKEAQPVVLVSTCEASLCSLSRPS